VACAPADQTLASDGQALVTANAEQALAADDEQLRKLTVLDFDDPGPLGLPCIIDDRYVRFSITTIIDMEDRDMEDASNPNTVARPRGSAGGMGDSWTMAALLAVLVGALVGAGMGLWDIVGADRLSLPVELAEGAGGVRPDEAGQYSLAVESATLEIDNPSVWQRLLLQLPGVLVASAVAFVGWQLFGVARSMRTGDLFSEKSVRRIRLSGIVTLLGGLVTALVGPLMALPVIDSARDDFGAAGGPNPLVTSAEGSFGGFAVAILFFALAEILRRGASLRRDLDGLV
jgi:Protein of unknown function (DUF2975)